MKRKLDTTLINSILSSTLGHQQWKNGQLASVKAALCGQDVLAILPTGAGKSCIYQVVGLYDFLYHKKFTVIFTPLISLMKDQVTFLMEKGIGSVCFYGDLPRDLRQRGLQAMLSDDPPVFVFVTPEALSCGDVHAALLTAHRRHRIARFVADEMQCVIQWGLTFRKSYLNLAVLRAQDQFPTVPILGLSGSMTQLDIEETASVLKLHHYHLTSNHLDRRNLTYIVKSRESNNFVSYILGRQKNIMKNECGLVFCRTPGRCRSVVERLRKKGIICKAYFGSNEKGMTDKERSRIQHEWKTGVTPIIVATNAFGMGIDKADVRYVIHWGLPGDLGAYYQETGRAGRDGLSADCVLYYSFTDLHVLWNIACRTQPGPIEIPPKVQAYAHQVLGMCLDPFRCRRYYILSHFDRDQYAPKYDRGEKCNGCDVCLGFVQRHHMWNLHKPAATMLRFLQNRSTMEKPLNQESLVSAVRAGHNFEDPTTRRPLTMATLKRVCYYLVIRGLLKEYAVPAPGHHYCNWYLKCSPEADDFINRTEFPIPLPETGFE